MGDDFVEDTDQYEEVIYNLVLDSKIVMNDNWEVGQEDGVLALVKRASFRDRRALVVVTSKTICQYYEGILKAGDRAVRFDAVNLMSSQPITYTLQ